MEMFKAIMIVLMMVSSIGVAICVLLEMSGLVKAGKKIEVLVKVHLSTIIISFTTMLGQMAYKLIMGWL